MKIQKIYIEDEQYPSKLKSIKNPPKQLYVLGNIELLNKPGIAIIGSRNCTEAGRKIAKTFARKLSQCGICINSGMAKGIDSEAHKGAINEIGKTVAVLGCGLNKIFPEENKELFYKIINNGGAVISEYENNVEAVSKQFVARNRIVSGMSIGVVVVEAAYRSGTSITANFAREEQKPIFCIPHDISNKLGIGTNKLLKKGAKCVVTVEDILEEYENLKGISLNNLNTSQKEEIDIKEVPKEYREIYKAIGNKAIHINNICQKTGLSITELNSSLTILELEGFIKRLPGNKFIIDRG